MTHPQTPAERLIQAEALLQRSVELRHDLKTMRSDVLEVLRRVDSFLVTRPTALPKIVTESTLHVLPDPEPRLALHSDRFCIDWASVGEIYAGRTPLNFFPMVA